MKLTFEQIEYIREVLAREGIEIQSLRDDLLDHLCCYIEGSAESSEDFQDLVRNGLNEVAPFGLHVLQNQTLLLLNAHKFLNMKRFNFIIGALSAMTWFTGVLFMLMHWPGGRQLAHYGLLVFVFVFLPMLGFLHSAVMRSPLERWKFILGLTSGILFSFSSTFKMLHLQGFDLVFLAATMFFVFVFLPFLFFTLYKNSMSQSNA